MLWGIDKLEATIEIKGYEEDTKALRAELADRKTDARLWRKPIPFIVGDRVFEVLVTGRRFYNYTLSHPDMIFWFTEKVIGNTPPVAVVLTSEFLWRMGPELAWDQVIKVLELLGMAYAGSKCSRVDYSLDQDYHRLQAKEVQDIVCRSRKREFMNNLFLAPFESRIGHHGHEWVRLRDIKNPDYFKPLPINSYGEVRRGHYEMTGVVVGKGGNLSFRGYNKSLEISRVSHKTWFFDLWEQQGMDPEREIWRWEFQVRRPVFRTLHELPDEPAGDQADELPYLNSAEDAIQFGPQAWGYLTQWLQFRDRTSDTNVTRAKVKPFWEKAMQPPQLADADPLQRTARVRQARWEMVRSMARPWLAYIAAAEGGVVDPDQVAGAVNKFLREDPQPEKFRQSVQLKRGQYFHKEGLTDVKDPSHRTVNARS